MEAGERLSLEQIRAIVAGIEGIRFAGKKRSEVYEFVGGTLREHNYEKQGRSVKGLLRTFIGRMTGLGRAQVTRLVGDFVENREVQEKPFRRTRFASRYTRADIELLESMTIRGRRYAALSSCALLTCRKPGYQPRNV